MTALNFPDDPTPGDIFTSGSRSWRWTETAWEAVIDSAPSYSYTTSSTSQSLTRGSKTFSVSQTGAYAVGNRVRIIHTGYSYQYLEGEITALAFNSSITVNVDTTSGSGTYSDWTFALAGEPGDGKFNGFLIMGA